MAPLRFVAVLNERKGNPYIQLSAAQVSMLKPGWKTSLPVFVRINGKPPKPMRLETVPMIDGSSQIILDREAIAGLPVRTGDHVHAEITVDTAPRPAVGIPIPYPNI